MLRSFLTGLDKRNGNGVIGAAATAVVIELSRTENVVNNQRRENACLFNLTGRIACLKYEPS